MSGAFWPTLGTQRTTVYPHHQASGFGSHGRAARCLLAVATFGSRSLKRPVRTFTQDRQGRYAFKSASNANKKCFSLFPSIISLMRPGHFAHDIRRHRHLAFCWLLGFAPCGRYAYGTQILACRLR